MSGAASWKGVACLDLAEGLLEVGEKIHRIFDTNREADEVRGHTGRGLLFLIQLLVGGGCGVDREGFGIADVGEVTEEFEAVDKGTACFESAFQAKANECSEIALGEILFRGSMVRALGESGIVDPGDLRVRFEEFRDFQGIRTMALHAEMEGLKSL